MIHLCAAIGPQVRRMSFGDRQILLPAFALHLEVGARASSVSFLFLCLYEQDTTTRCAKLVIEIKITSVGIQSSLHGEPLPKWQYLFRFHNNSRKLLVNNSRVIMRLIKRLSQN